MRVARAQEKRRMPRTMTLSEEGRREGQMGGRWRLRDVLDKLPWGGPS